VKVVLLVQLVLDFHAKLLLVHKRLKALLLLLTVRVIRSQLEAASTVPLVTGFNFPVLLSRMMVPIQLDGKACATMDIRKLTLFAALLLNLPMVDLPTTVVNLPTMAVVLPTTAVVLPTTVILPTVTLVTATTVVTTNIKLERSVKDKSIYNSTF